VDGVPLERYTNCTTGGPVYVYVEDGRIVRITPIEFDADDAPSWKIEARGRSFTPPRRTTVSPYASAMKSLIDSPRRILTPLRRVDYHPERGEINGKNRGVSGYVPISWDEAFALAGGEIRRIRDTCGPGALAFAHSSHQLWGYVGYWMSCWNRFKNLLGFTDITSNPDSWEGWHWGAMHTWGFSWRYGMPEQYDLLEDALQNTELIVFWSSDPEATSGVYAAHESTPRRFWLKELGVEMVSINPYYDHTAKLFADKWIAPRMGTDNALALAIAYVWITEDLYKREFVETHTTGFDQFRAYVLGETDGIPKTPDWAAAECDVPAREIRALARKWGQSRTMLAAGGMGGFGGACRRATGNEWAKLMVCLAAMQGIGTPGSNLWSTQQGTPVDCEFLFPGYSEGGIAGDGGGEYRWNARMFPDGRGKSGPVAPAQTLMKLAYPDAVGGHTSAKWRFKGVKTLEQQFGEHQYPAPGQPEIKLIYRFGGSSIGTMSQSDRYASMYQTDRVECVINQSIWMEGEAPYADIIFPACTNFERWDISEFAHAGGYLADSFTQNNHRVIVLQKQCIPPLGQSRSDYWILDHLAEAVGLGEQFRDGKRDEMDWIRQIFDASDLPKYTTWERFYEKGYFVVPVREDRRSTPALRWFAEGRPCDTPDWTLVTGDRSRLQTASGRIEFEASSLKKLQGDPARPALPKYIPSWEGPDSPIAARYPLSLLSPHPRYSFHTVGDAKDSFLNDIPDHRLLVDGHYYWIARMNPVDAEARGLRDGELVLLYNDRAGVICALQVTERVRPGVVHSYGSSAAYEPLGPAGASVDRGGCVNMLISKRYITETACGMALDCQLEVKRWEGETVIPAGRERLAI
jgi:anaerobic selenocysteine-containing dehydrogenase